MLDKYVYRAGDNHTTRIEVKQAGLHDATKNYKEFRDDAEREAAKLEIKRFGAENCVRYLKSEVVRSMMDRSTNAHIVYEINGTVHQLKTVYHDNIKACEEERMNLARHIAAEIVGQIIKDRII